MAGQESAMRRFERFRHALDLQEDTHQIIRSWVRDGNGVAFRELGTAHAYGLGVDEVQAFAVLYWQMGADLGDAVCQANLGSRFLRGYGVAMDEEEGFAYYVRSANQGHYAGIYGLAMCHENGEGIATNLDTAWSLINKALAAAHAAAGTDGGLAEDYLDDIHASLARINYKRGGGHGVVVFGGGGDVGGDWRERVVSIGMTGGRTTTASFGMD